MNDVAGGLPTYYEQAAVKHSLWGAKVSIYMFVAGLAGSSQIVAAAADLAGGAATQGIVRRGRFIALAGALVGGPLLIVDLHTPQRFYNMLRIFRRTSPMSIGTYVLMSFGALSAFLAAVEAAKIRGPLPGALERAAKVAQVPAAVAGAAMSTYTGARLAATSTPLWASAPRLIAAAFGASAMSSAAAALTIGEESEEAQAALDRLSLVAETAELCLLSGLRGRFREAEVDGVLRETGWGPAYDIAVAALGAGLPLGLRVSGTKSPGLRLVGALAVLAGAFALRHVLLRAGNESAKRPRDYFRVTRRTSPPRTA